MQFCCNILYQSIVIDWVSLSRVGLPYSLFVSGKPFTIIVGRQRGAQGWVPQAVQRTTLHQHLLGGSGRRRTTVRNRELPGPWTQHPLNKVSKGEQQQHYENPREFPRDHGDAVVSVVHELLATGDIGGVVSSIAALFVISTDVPPASLNRINYFARKNEKHDDC